MPRNRRYGAPPHNPYATESAQDATRRAADAASLACSPINVKLRGLTIDDAAFIIDSWCSSYHRSPVVGPVDPKLFKIEQRARINRLLPKSKIIIACDTEDTRHIYGWICYTPNKEASQLPTVHYMCVKPEYQGQGIGKSLIDLVRQACNKASYEPLFYGHWTPVCKRLESRWNLLYNPYVNEVI